MAAKYGIKRFSNYIVYNTDDDKPEEFYYRLRLNAKLLDELGVHIFSFPMKYQPLDDPEHSSNRNFVGKHWNEQYLRSISFVLNSFKGVVVSDADYSYFSFGRDLDNFKKILSMPEALIKERHRYDREAHDYYVKELGKKSDVSSEALARDGDTTNKWWNALNALSSKHRLIAETIINNNDFSDEILTGVDADVRAALAFYKIKYGANSFDNVEAGIETADVKPALPVVQTPVAETANNQFIAVDLFCGAGGMSHGFQNAGFDVTGFELWKTAADTHDANFKNPVHRVDLADVENAARIIRDINPLIITGSPPCQDFSTAGKRTEGDRAGLTVSFAMIVVQTAPRFFVMENVPCVQQSEAYKAARELFKKAGYGLTETVLTASYYGVPQRRERFFCIGGMGADDGFLLETLEQGKSSTEMTVRDYFGNSLEFEHYYAKPPYASGLRRSIFNIDEPSLTIRGVNGNITSDFKRHNGDSCELNPSVRKLTYLERSQIQTFPADFKWDKGIGKKGGTGDIEQMIGNAVPVKLAEAVAACIKEYHTSANRVLCVPVANDGERSVLDMTNNTQITVQNQSTTDEWVQDTSKTVSNVRTRRDIDSTKGVSVVQQQFDELRNFVLGRSSRRQKAGAV